MTRDRTRNLVLGAWGGLSVVTAAITIASAHRIPFSDDWNLLPVIAGDRPVTWSWLWAQHNEHRTPLLKGTHLVLLRTFGFDYRSIVLLHVLVISGTGFWLTCSFAKDRGRWSSIDVLPALILLNPALGIYAWSFYTQFVAAILAILLIADLPDRGTRIGTIVRLALAMLLSATGGVSGLVLLPAVCARCLVLARRRRRGDVGTAVGAASVGALAALAGVAYFVGYDSIEHPWARPGFGTVAWWSVRIAGLAMGPQLDRLWPLTAIGVACISISVVWGWRRGWLSLSFPRALALVMMGVLAGTVAIGRAGRSWAGVGGHYAPLMAPLLPIVAGVWSEGNAPPRIDRVRAALQPVALAAFSATFALGAVTTTAQGPALRSQESEFEDALSTMSDEKVITTHIELLYFVDSASTRDILTDSLPSYRRARN